MLTVSATSSIPITRAITLAPGTPITGEIGPSASRFKHTGAPRKQRGRGSPQLISASRQLAPLLSPHAGHESGAAVAVRLEQRRLAFPQIEPILPNASMMFGL